MSRGDVKVEEITTEAQRCELGEGPHWDVERQSLYYVDINRHQILRYDFKTGEIFKATLKDEDSPIGFIIPVGIYICLKFLFEFISKLFSRLTEQLTSLSLAQTVAYF
jgi:SMP-30/Gluconolactonase/LRE-like region